MSAIFRCLAASLAIACAPVLADAPAKGRTMQQVLDASTPADWRTPAPQDTLYLDLAAGRVVIELAPSYAPLHAANIRTMAHEHYFDGLAILRVQTEGKRVHRRRFLQALAALGIAPAALRFTPVAHAASGELVVVNWGGDAVPAHAGLALILLLVAALGGFFLASYHVRKVPGPKAVVLIHAAVAATGVVLLAGGAYRLF